MNIKTTLILLLLLSSLFSASFDKGSAEAVTISYVRALYSGDIERLQKFMSKRSYITLRRTLFNKILDHSNFHNPYTLEHYLHLDTARKEAKKKLEIEVASEDERNEIFEKILKQAGDNINYHNPNAVKVKIIEVDTDLWGDKIILAKINIDNSTKLFISFELTQTKEGWLIHSLPQSQTN
jgi:intein/homing endonuclease